MAYSTGKLAVITGAGSGIGRALAHQFNAAGCRLLLSDIDPNGLEKTLATLPRSDIVAKGQVLDVADKAAVHQYADDIEAEYAHIDILINNAGVALMATAEETQYDDIEWLMSINFWGVVYGTKAFLPLLRKSQQGHLVNISSIFGIIGVPTQSAYNAAKFAVRGYTEALRQELSGGNVHVCCVHPGGIKTNIAINSRSKVTGAERQASNASFEQLARTTANSAARQIITGIEKRKIRLLIGGDAKFLSLLSRLFPVNYARLMPGLAKTLDTMAS
ncbi:MAG: NADP-dependent 3-hydroxy acid dehydrogenase YdfG [Halioglobus sp.]|jgi:NADP-dependent 3-hydroxy acid dehydrogenase YdfG